VRGLQWSKEDFRLQSENSGTGGRGQQGFRSHRRKEGWDRVRGLPPRG
jgi:hypothetical protein